MSCGCNRRARATARGETLKGYRVYLDTRDSQGNVVSTLIIPPVEESPFFSVPEAKAAVRQYGGGTVQPEYRKAG
jgi:hypothetical protein